MSVHDLPASRADADTAALAAHTVEDACLAGGHTASIQADLQERADAR